MGTRLQGSRLASRPAIEAELVLCLSRAELPSGSRKRALALLGRNPDWTKFEMLVERHGVGPLIHRHLESVGADTIPRAVRARLWARCQKTLARNRSMSRALLEVLKAFEDAGIRALAFKGPALAVQLYEDEGLREFGDLDLLVHFESLQAAKEVMSALGYDRDAELESHSERAMLQSRLYYHLAFFRASDGILVELHWKTDAEFAVESTHSPEWWASLGTVCLHGANIRAFNPDELLLVLLLHGAKHGWNRLAWLVDVAELLRREPRFSWTRIHEVSQRLGCRRRVAAGLLLANELLGAPVPEGAVDTLCSSAQIDPVALRIATGLFESAPATPGALQSLMRDVSLYDRPSQRLAHAASVLFAPSLAEWSRWRLPPALHFAYRPLRLLRLLGKYASSPGRL